MTSIQRAPATALAGKRLGVVLPLALLCAACDSAGETEIGQANGACAVPSSEAAEAVREGVVVVSGEDAACDVVFEPVLTLTGGSDGTLPKFPVAAAPGGRWVTGTYGEGQIAVWSPSGELERVIGRGPGGGPGEFGDASDLIVDSIAGTVHVFTRSHRIEVYSLGGDYVGGVSLPRPASMGARLTDGTLATSAHYPMDSPRIMLVGQDTVFETGPARRMPMSPDVRGGGEGVWTGESSWYQFDHHALPSGQVDFTVRREVSWFPELSDEEGATAAGPLVNGFTIDPERQLVFARVVQVKDPDAPDAPSPRSAPAGGESTPIAPISREDAREMNILRFDGVIEAFTLDGRLIASTRFDDGSDMPNPLAGGAPGTLWYRTNDDMTRSIEILRATLVEKPVQR